MSRRGDSAVERSAQPAPPGKGGGVFGREERPGPASRTLLNQLAREEREVRRSISSLRHRRRCQAMPAEGGAERQISLFEAALLAEAHQHEEVVWGRLADKSRALADVQASLREGTYGRCRGCGCRIPPRRLAAMPTATLCVSCQEQREADGSAS